jgi:hypothetical protein
MRTDPASLAASSPFALILPPPLFANALLSSPRLIPLLLPCALNVAYVLANFSLLATLLYDRLDLASLQVKLNVAAYAFVMPPALFYFWFRLMSPRIVGATDVPYAPEPLVAVVTTVVANTLLLAPLLYAARRFEGGVMWIDGGIAWITRMASTKRPQQQQQPHDSAM